jgi:alkaline phosphatase
MRRFALLLVLTGGLAGGALNLAQQRGGQDRGPLPPASPEFRIIPPNGATFAPGQRFDIRIEADNLPGVPEQYSFEINGRDEKRNIFGSQNFATFPSPAAAGRPAGTGLNGGVIRRNWSLDRPGRYSVSATLELADGAKLTAKSTFDIAALSPTPERARNIILFIGDGMGVAQRTAARIASRGIVGGKAQGLLFMDQMEANGFVMTSSLDALVTDSSPGAAGYATGNKSLNNWHGVFPDNNGPITGNPATLDRNPDAARAYFDNPKVENIAEFLQRTQRMSTGVVSTVAVTDSTPGSFSSHAIRFAQTGIAEQMLLSAGHSVILGGGSRYFLPAGHPHLKNIPSSRSDSRNLVEEFQKAGFTFVSTATELQKAGKVPKLLGFFHGAEMSSRYDRMHANKGINASKEAVGEFPDQPNLETMTQYAINVLSQNSNGFFLMVEGGSIDREYHRMDPNRAIYETIELDNAIGVALAWASQRGNEDTLIIVTADHETSGLALTGVLENGRIAGRAFPDYRDADHDGFPDTMQPDVSMEFSFAKEANPPRGTRNHEYPRNLLELNPSTTVTPQRGGPQSGHSAVDVFIAAHGPGSRLFGSVMDNTEVFFKILRALGER